MSDTAQQQSEELSCPFCGSDEQSITTYSCSERGDGAIVECTKCGAQGPFAANDDAAEKAWDTRAPAKDRDELLAIIRDARSFVSDFYPQHAEAQRDQEAMLARIDAVLPPPPPEPPFVMCDDPLCTREKGHDGPHEDIPF